MVYVDLNPIRAGLAETPETPEESEFTSIYERIQFDAKQLKGKHTQSQKKLKASHLSDLIGPKSVMNAYSHLSSCLFILLIDGCPGSFFTKTLHDEPKAVSIVN